jgi:hypothetical protein
MLPSIDKKLFWTMIAASLGLGAVIVAIKLLPSGNVVTDTIKTVADSAK